MNTFMIILAQFFYNEKTFHTKVVEKIRTQILSSVTFSWKSCRLWDSVEKYWRAEQATEDNMAHVQCMLDT